MTSALLIAQNLVKTYPSATVPALAGVNVVIRGGESVAIMGPSGSGKTTLLHALAGIITVDSGRVVLAGPTGDIDVSSLSEAKRSKLRRDNFGFVFQHGLLIPELTAVENAALPLLIGGVARTEAERYAAEWLAALGLAGLAKRRIGELSGGQAQRVAIARAQVTGAPVVFADEPTGALDSSTSVEVLDALLTSTVGQGRSLVIVTHDEDVSARCARVIRVRDGRIERESPGRAADRRPSFHGDGWNGGVAGGAS